MTHISPSLPSASSMVATDLSLLPPPAMGKPKHHSYPQLFYQRTVIVPLRCSPTLPTTSDRCVVVGDVIVCPTFEFLPPVCPLSCGALWLISRRVTVVAKQRANRSAALNSWRGACHLRQISPFIIRVALHSGVSGRRQVLATVSTSTYRWLALILHDAQNSFFSFPWKQRNWVSGQSSAVGGNPNNVRKIEVK